MAASAIASPSSSLSISKHTLRTPSTSSHNQPLLAQNQKTAFRGLSLWEGERVSFIVELKKSGGRNGGANGVRRGLEISAKTAGASKSIEVEVDKPVGLTLGRNRWRGPDHCC